MYIIIVKKWFPQNSQRNQFLFKAREGKATQYAVKRIALICSTILQYSSFFLLTLAMNFINPNFFRFMYKLMVNKMLLRFQSGRHR